MKKRKRKREREKESNGLKEMERARERPSFFLHWNGNSGNEHVIN